jgi:hypothetical protein
MTDLALKLTPQAVIMGRILDDEGEPVVNARVALQGYRYSGLMHTMGLC